MKLLKKTGIYKAANVIFNPKTLDATSYNWWRFVGLVEGVLVESTYRYSVTTAKHQRKVRGIMNELGIKPKLSLPLPRGVRHDQTLAEMICEAETHLCEQFLEEQVKKQKSYAKAKRRRLKKKLEDYLENECAFRDYEIRQASQFREYNKIGVHQVVEAASLERDVENAIEAFHKDGFSNIIFYV